MEKNSNKDFINDKKPSKVINRIKNIEIDKKQKKTFKKRSIDIQELNINTNNKSKEEEQNFKYLLSEQKNIFKNEIYNNKVKNSYQEKELKNTNLKNEKYSKENNNNIKYNTNQNEFQTKNNYEKNNKKDSKNKSNEYEIKNEERKEINSKERKNKKTFNTILLNKKMKLFDFSNDSENNNNFYINVKDLNLISTSFRNIKNNQEIIGKKQVVPIKNKEENKNKISFKKLKLELNKDNNKYKGENKDKEILKFEDKIKQNKEILFKSQDDQALIKEKNNISYFKKNKIDKNDMLMKLVQKKEKKDEINKVLNKQKYNVKNINKSQENIISIPKKNDNNYKNRNKISNEKNKEKKLPNKIEDRSKNQINKVKVINFNFKKNLSPIRINISLNNNSSEINEKLLMLSENDSFDDIETDNFSLLKTHKNLKIKRNIFNKEIKEKSEDKSFKKESKTAKKKGNENYKKNKIIKLNFNIDKLSPSKKRKNKKRNLDQYKNDLILFKKNYKSFLNAIAFENSMPKFKSKKEIRFKERKKNEKNKGLRLRLAETYDDYNELLRKEFNDISLKQKFFFKPKINKKYNNYEYNNIKNNNDNNNKSIENNSKINKKISSTSFNSKRDGKLEQELDISKNFDKKRLNTNLNSNKKNIIIKDISEFDNNKNSILDLNHFIPIDKKKLINIIE